jgi:hypothetical protein
VCKAGREHDDGNVKGLARLTEEHEGKHRQHPDVAVKLGRLSVHHRRDSNSSHHLHPPPCLLVESFQLLGRHVLQERVPLQDGRRRVGISVLGFEPDGVFI